jgi:hypothetical protein
MTATRIVAAMADGCEDVRKIESCVAKQGAGLLRLLI